VTRASRAASTQTDKEKTLSAIRELTHNIPDLILADAPTTTVSERVALAILDNNTVAVVRFADRGHRLAHFCRRYTSIEDAVADEVKNLETSVLGRRVDEVGAATEAFFLNSSRFSAARRWGSMNGCGASFLRGRCAP
jgi:hypothetical protein